MAWGFVYKRQGLWSSFFHFVLTYELAYLRTINPHATISLNFPRTTPFKLAEKQMLPIIITGGPGAGKTSLINQLAQQGYQTFAEVSRDLIEQQAQLENGILPWHDLPGFADLCLTHMGEQKQQAAQHSVAFLDRAIPDICGYLAEAKLDIDARYIEASAGYNPQVFFCRPHQAIYVQDEVRPYPFAGALAIHNALVAIYQQLGYQVVEVPWGSLDERVAFIESAIALPIE